MKRLHPQLFQVVLKALVFCFLFAGTSPAWGEDFSVAAASDLQFALRELIHGFEAQSGHHVRVSFGSSGQFCSQIQQGAPYALFLSADQHYVNLLLEKGLTRDHGVLYAQGRIALFAPQGSVLKVEKGLAGLLPLLAAGKIRHFAIANPQHAPYGRAAKQALLAAGVWNALQGHLLMAENASQAAQFSLSGSSEGGLIPLSLVLAPAFKNKGRFLLVPENLHAPLLQRMVLLKNASRAAQDFYLYLQTGRARQVLMRYGFALPDS